VLEIEKPNKNIIQTHNEISSSSQKKNNNEKKVPKEKGKNRIRYLIQLYKEEVDIFSLFDKSINEKDMKEYYLINNKIFFKFFG
jgi:hypothetical protein